MDDYPLRQFKYLFQNVTEEGAILLLLYNMTRGLKPSVIVEIGTGTSHTTSAFIEALDENNIQATLFTIDIEPHIAQNMIGNKYLRSYICKSDDAFKEWDKNKNIDILYIDGDHHYEQCKRDFEQWSQYVNKYGFVLIHDTNNYWWPDLKIIINEIKNSNQWDNITLPYGYGLTILQRKN